MHYIIHVTYLLPVHIVPIVAHTCTSVCIHVQYSYRVLCTCSYCYTCMYVCVREVNYIFIDHILGTRARRNIDNLHVHAWAYFFQES